MNWNLPQNAKPRRLSLKLSNYPRVILNIVKDMLLVILNAVKNLKIPYRFFLPAGRQAASGLRMTRLSLASIFLAFAFCVISARSALASQERILSFDSYIRVNYDGSMFVTENIRVLAQQEAIKRGIYRDFPTRYRDRFGNKYVVGFDLRRVLRDGYGEKYSLKPMSNGVRIYIGNPNVYLQPGEYIYTVEYKTARQLGFFKDHDELYWNVTGNGWEFPIDEVTCTVELPSGAQERVRFSDAYTGYQGQRGKDFSLAADEFSRPQFQTTRSLAAYEGLTIVVGWPKGYVRAPALADKIQHLLQDNAGVLAGLASLIFIIGYYLFIWNSVGRDPQKGVIIPLYHPDKNISPAAMRYIAQMGYDHKVFTAAIINLAVKGYLIIREDQGRFSLARTSAGGQDMSAEEKAIADSLFAGEETLILSNSNHSVIGRAILKLKTSLRKTYETNYFVVNRGYFSGGAALSLLGLLICELLFSGEKIPIAIFMTAWLTGWSFGLAAMIMRIVANIRSSWALMLFAIPFIIGEFVGLGVLISVTSFFFTLFFAAVIAVNIIFYYLLKAPTALGRRTMDRIEGFKLYLSVAERAELKTAVPGEQTPELYEKYLPYALALGVEQQWSERFSQILAQAGREGQPYRPIWYASSSLSHFTPVAFASNLGSAFSGAIASSAVAPGSSSGYGGGGGGGGSSGGGGGGGGGGGW